MCVHSMCVLGNSLLTLNYKVVEEGIDPGGYVGNVVTLNIIHLP